MTPGKIFTNFKRSYAKLLGIKATPHSLALGFSIGSFWSILPTPGFSITLGIVTCLVFPTVSKIAMTSAFALWNPIVCVPIYALSYKIGNVLFTSSQLVEIEYTLWNHVLHFSRRFLVGSGIIALIISLVSYFIVKMAVIEFKKRQIGRNILTRRKNSAYTNQ